MRMPSVPTHSNGHVLTEPERQLRRLLISGRTRAQSAKLMAVTRQELTALEASLRSKGLGPMRKKRRARAARSERSHTNPDLRRRLGAHVRALRVSRRMTQADLAGDEFTAAFISMIEGGKAAPSLDSLAYFAARLQVSLRELVPPEL